MQYLIEEKRQSLAILTINRPEVLNALNRSLMEELLEYLEINAKQQQLKAVILTGFGDKAFIAGADIKEMQSMTYGQMRQFTHLGQRVANALEKAPFLTIAAVNGFALGGGLEMALACDFIYASNQAKFGLPEVTLGLIPGFGGTQRLARAIGTRQAKEWVMSGRIVSAEVALESGLINRLCEPTSLLNQCEETALKIIKNSFVAVIQAKTAINEGVNLGMESALELERNLFSLCFNHPDSRKAMAAFLDKKKKG